MRLVVAVVFAVLATAQVTQRERTLQEKLVAVCCWSESIAFHRSEKAAEMRAELRGMIDAGLGDEVILQRFQDKYSARVLIEPQGGTSVLIYTVPAVLTVVCFVGLVWFLRRWVRRAPTNGGS